MNKKELIEITEEKLKIITCAFFRHWWNTEGNNTEEGFNEWWIRHKYTYLKNHLSTQPPKEVEERKCKHVWPLDADSDGRFRCLDCGEISEIIAD